MELKIRAVSEADAEELVEIYRYYVEHTAITYECHVPSVEEIQRANSPHTGKISLSGCRAGRKDRGLCLCLSAEYQGVL